MIGSGVLGFCPYNPYWCPSPFPSPFILGVFHSLLSAIGFQSCFFFTTEVSPPIRSTLPSLTHFLGEFPGLGLALVPDVVVPEAEQRCAWSRKIDPNFCPGMVQPRILASRLPPTPPFSRLLRHAGGYSRKILTPNLQGY